MKLVIQVRDDQLVDILNEYPDKLLALLVGAMDRYTVELQALVKTKLSDGVLHVRTGNLRGSINRKVFAEGGSVVRGIVGTNVRYASVHEYGFVGTVQVPEHIRRITSSKRTPASFDRARIGRIGEKRLRYVNGTTTVRAHDMRMNIPERSFLRSSLADTVEDARRILGAAVKEAFHP